MLAMIRLQKRPIPTASTASNGTTSSRTRGRRLVSAFALLTVCLFAAHSLPSMASERSPELAKKGTQTALKASASTINEDKKITLTATVTPSKAKGTVTFYGRKAPTDPFQEIGKSSVVAGVAKLSGHIGIPGKIGFLAFYNGSSTYKTSASKIVTVISKK
jgi:hypothetical protein